MKWNDLPIWMKVLIIVFIVVLVAYLIKVVVDYFKAHKYEIYQKLRAVRQEINHLVSEKQRIVKALIRAKLYTRFTVTLIKIAHLGVFIWFTNFLMLEYKFDQFTALATSAGSVVIIYNILACLFDFKIRGLNELRELTIITLEGLYIKKLNADPAQIIIIDSKIEALEKQVVMLKASLNL